jgi:hypothetical protein
VRPIKENFFIFDANKFEKAFQNFIITFKKLRAGQPPQEKKEIENIDKVAYTIQQSIGIGLDLLSTPNSARKHVGNRFEEFIRLLISELGIANNKVVFKIPYPTDEGEKTYSCETDIIISPFDKVKSNSKLMAEKEIVVSLKTSSKDRMGKIGYVPFLVEILMAPRPCAVRRRGGPVLRSGFRLPL